MYNKILDPLTDVRVSTEMLLSGSLGSLRGDQREQIKQLYSQTSSLYTLFVDVIMAIGLEKIAARPYLSDRFDKTLNPMLSISQGLLDEIDGPLLEEQLVSVQFISEMAQKLMQYVDRLWLYSQLENDMITPQRQSVSLGTLLTEIQQTSEQGNRLDIVPGCQAELKGDVQLTHVILKEVIANALQFSMQGQITITCELDSAHLSITVSDSGTGIAPIYQKTIFDAFSQVDETTEGLGLGLYFVKKLVQLHDGTVELTSRIHAGSQFKLRFPITP